VNNQATTPNTQERDFFLVITIDLGVGATLKLIVIGRRFQDRQPVGAKICVIIILEVNTPRNGGVFYLICLLLTNNTHAISTSPRTVRLPIPLVARSLSMCLKITSLATSHGFFLRKREKLIQSPTNKTIAYRPTMADLRT